MSDVCSGDETVVSADSAAVGKELRTAYQKYNRREMKVI